MLSSLLFSEYRKRILGLLLLHPNTSYHMRELARLTSTASGTLHKELVKLTAGGILQSKKVGNQVHYSANTQCRIFSELASILRKTSGLTDVVAEVLVGVKDQITLAFIYGSIARGEEQAASDVDIMLIGALSFGDAVTALYACQSTLQREITPVVYSVDEFNRRLQQQDSFLNDVLTKPKLFIIGNENELRKLTEN